MVAPFLKMVKKKEKMTTPIKASAIKYPNCIYRFLHYRKRMNTI